ncbi:acid phosphatase/Vanadium-dependent haloperoxidase [Daldinia vernicosa]|uniref:acid phosphatase/Vanadium-dependent haloperoxidase n=1 Tax=Daldinia vernicosa TaxID=114800 RepID=UPI0020083507|nr:acid phosphatase/Vanadium-dependent haloperoxidase [Daldinia vernicosa]KAI0850115.1 acid phosphatase/Vanadium-dependent haloperoxidase [Daldinia vernicosa]
MDPYVGGRRVSRSHPARNPSRAEKLYRWLKSPPEPYSIEKRPSFSLWLRVTWPDIVTMLLLGVVAFGVYLLRPIGVRTFPLTVIDARTGEDTGEVVYPEFAYPYRRQFISSEVDTILAIVFPLFTFLLIQIRIRNFWDLNNAIIGCVYALETSAAFQVMIKWLVGGLRPHFYDICQPDPSLAYNPDVDVTGLNAVGYRQYMYTSEICTIGQGRALWNAMQSFPSGHSTTSCAAGVYVSLYINAKLKVFANYHPAMWKLVLVYCPILGAALICGSLTVDGSHNWYDILAGATIGTVIAVSSYRTVYASVWDWRINHIPLNRGAAFIPLKDSLESSDLVFTNRAGWGRGHSNDEKETLPGPVTGSGVMGSHPSVRSERPPDSTASQATREPQNTPRLSRDRDRGADMVQG